MHVRAGQWRAFACAAHADRLDDDPKCADVGPLDDAAAAELADRHERWQAALGGRDDAGRSRCGHSAERGAALIIA
jgi:hypothetical protein